jgi:hypothetical protein
MLAVLALVPALVGAGLGVAAVMNRRSDGTALVELTSALSALAVAGSLALLWLLVGAINWQIKEATRGRG